MTKNVLYVGLNPTHFKTEGKLTHFPLIEIIPRPPTDLQVQSALDAFSSYTHIIITSKSTVKILKDYVPLDLWKKKEYHSRWTDYRLLPQRNWDRSVHCCD